MVLVIIRLTGFLHVGLAIIIGFVTLLHAVEVWRNGNRGGALAVALLGLANLALPVYLQFIQPINY